MMNKHGYTARDVTDMRIYAYNIANSHLKTHGFDANVKSNADKISAHLLLAESILQSYLIAGVSPEDLEQLQVEAYPV